MQFPQNGMCDPSQWVFIHRNLLRDDTQFAELKDDNQFAEKTLEEINYSVKKFDHLKGLLTWRKNDRIVQFEDFVLNISLQPSLVSDAYLLSRSSDFFVKKSLEMLMYKDRKRKKKLNTIIRQVEQFGLPFSVL